MSDDQQREEMRPIPDGGLKDAMPSWLKRPPAWRSMPSAEERHERKLPEPDTSEINPKTLVDVNDLPQWLQSIAARGEVPLPQPDEAVGHALEQLQAVSARSREMKSVAAENTGDDQVNVTTSGEPTNVEGTNVNKEPELNEPKTSIQHPDAHDEPVAESSPMPIAMVLSICAAIVVVIVVAYWFV